MSSRGGPAPVGPVSGGHRQVWGDYVSRLSNSAVLRSLALTIGAAQGPPGVRDLRACAVCPVWRRPRFERHVAVPANRPVAGALCRDATEAARLALVPPLIDLSPETNARPALLVVTPGVDLTAFLPLARALRADGMDVQALVFPAAGQTSADYADAIASAAASLPDNTVVVSHGLGATLALLAAPRLHVDRYVLLAPVLDVSPVAVDAFLADQPVAASLDLSHPVEWAGRDARAVLLGPELPDLGVVSGPFAAEVQGWIRAAHVPIDLSHVDRPVWIAVSLGDSVASVEAVVPASRALPERHLVRLGINRMDPQDFTHAEMLADRIPIRAATRAARSQRWIRRAKAGST